MSREKLRTLIVDDEALARRGLELRLKGHTEIDIIGQARNGREALQMISEERPDLVFLDVQMPGINGFDVVRQIPLERMPAVVFVTAFDQYAINAFEANALDYLLKPIDDSRLHQAIFRVREHLVQLEAMQHKRSLLKLVSDLTGTSVDSMQELESKQDELLKPQEPARLAIKDGSKTTWVNQNEIQWIDAAGDYMCIHVNGETHIMRKTMKELEQELDASFLQRIHRSTIVNVRRVTELQSHINGEYFLTLDCGHTVKLSRSYKDKLSYFA